MATKNSLKELVVTMLKEITQLNDALIELDSLIDKEAEYIQRQERIANINALKSILVNEVQRIQDEEYNSKRNFNTSKVFNSIVGFASGSIVGAMSKHGNPFLLGAESFLKHLDKKADFGNVMIAINIKESGKLEDIEVIAVSRLARESKTTEQDIISSIKREGYLLLTPEEFWQSLDRLKEEIMADKYS